MSSWKTPLVNEMIAAAEQSVESIKRRISGVRYGKSGNSVFFFLDEEPMKVELTGRNADAVIGISEDADKAIALRALLDLRH